MQAGKVYQKAENNTLKHILRYTVGTLDNPIGVTGFGSEQYIGCTGCPADSHVVIWLVASRDRPIERCPECGSVYRFDYVGPPDVEHGHGDAHHEHHEHAADPVTIADFVRAEYR